MDLFSSFLAVSDILKLLKHRFTATVAEFVQCQLEKGTGKMRQEHDFDLKLGETVEKGLLRRVTRKNMNRLVAVILSVVLAAGMCLPAAAAESTEIRVEETGSSISAGNSQAVEGETEETDSALEESEATSEDQSGAEAAEEASLSSAEEVSESSTEEVSEKMRTLRMRRVRVQKESKKIIIRLRMLMMTRLRLLSANSRKLPARKVILNREILPVKEEYLNQEILQSRKEKTAAGCQTMNIRFPETELF